MRDLYVITHAESRHHVEGRVGGWYDTGLTERGRRQAEAIAIRLRTDIGDSIPRLFSSDLARAGETAAAIANELRVPLTEMSDLREKSYGIAEGKPEAWLEERFVPAPDHDRLDHRSIEGGETRRELATRIYRAMEAILASDHPVQVIVTHGLAMTFVVAAWVGMPIETVGSINLRSSPGGITHLHEDDYFRNNAVWTLNATDHLPPD